MPFNAPASVPQIAYASYTPPPNAHYYPPVHSTFTAVPSPPPTQRDVYTNHKLNQHFVSTKAALLIMLRTRQLPNLPFGFPFRGSVDDIDLSSYEFPEYVTIDPMSPPSCVIFSYTAPVYHYGPIAKCGSSSSKMTWRIEIPSRDTMCSSEARSHTISQVEMDPELTETPFGFEFMNDKDMLIEALFVSLEQGVHLTMQLALSIRSGSAENKYKSRDRKRLDYGSDDVVFVAKHSDGRREVVHVLGQCGTFARNT